MKRLKTDIAIIGAGPSGLNAAIVCASNGLKVIVIDENSRAGGQLFKQIHRFFGSKEHMAGTRGIDIGRALISRAESAGAEILLDSIAYGYFPNEGIGLIHQGEHFLVESKKVILATGSRENCLAFPGCTLPGVIGAGAAQTMANVNYVLPGKRILMVGSGNVGLIVAYQLLQAGASISCIVESGAKINGYGVHAAKIRRAGVPILTNYSICEAIGNQSVEQAVIAKLDEQHQFLEETKQTLDVDTICLSVGLSPMTELAWQAGCKFTYSSALGGHIPLHDDNMQTTVPGLYVAGDMTGVEEASCALEEGLLAGIDCAQSLGAITSFDAQQKKESIRRRIRLLRCGPFGEKRQAERNKQLREMNDYIKEVRA